MSTGLVYHPDYLKHRTGHDHPERPQRLEAILQGLAHSGLMEKLVPIAPREALQAELERVHTSEYIALVRSIWEHGLEELDPDTVVSPGTLRAALLAAGGALAAVDAVMAGTVRNAFVACRPPGHHATPDRAMGFCLFNNVALAARHLQAVHGLERVLIVDWDLHHGNGTQDIFYDDPTVLYVSSHQYPYYPGTGTREERGTGAGTGYTINLPLLPGTPAAAQVKLLLDVFHGPARAFRPQFILISCGLDAHKDDPMSALSLEAKDYATLTRALVELAQEHAHGRLVSVLEGGYNLSALAESAAAHVQELVAG
ncbi:MAG: histone deacetylase [Deinococcus sp.]|nr:histone deacetylase [Deinococcus sp.]